MKKIMLIFFSCIFIISCKDKEAKLPLHIYDPCVDGKDTTINLNFLIDTTSIDFIELLKLFETQTEFKNIDLKTIHKDTGLILQKLLCYDKYYESAIEKVNLENVYTLSYNLVSIKNEKGYKKYHPSLTLKQINFKTEQEKDSALKIIRDIGLGDPLQKWNDYSFAISKTRIYVLSNGDATFQDYDEKYIDFIKKNWIIKNNF